MLLFGRIYKVNKRYIKVITRKNLLNLYITPLYYNKFKKQLIKDSYIIFNTNLKNITKIYRVFIDDVYLFSKRVNNKNLYNVLKNNKYYLFLDLEKTIAIPPKIFQISFIVTDSNFNIIYTYNKFLNTKTKFNSSTKDFFEYDFNHVSNNSISFGSFYKSLSKVVAKYKPTLVTYGKNDYLDLSHLFKLYKVINILENLKRIDLLSLCVLFYDLDTNISLFHLYKIYSNKDLEQVHNSLHDSFITLECYKSFYHDVYYNKSYLKLRK